MILASSAPLAPLVALAMAAALKVYPCVLGLLLVFNRQWSRCFRLLVYGILLSFLPFLWFPGGFDLIPELIFNVTAPASLMHPPCLLFCTWSPLFQKMFPGMLTAEIQHGLYYLGASVGILSCFAAYFDRKMWRKTTLIVLTLLLIPKVGGSYNLLYLIPGLVLFLNDESRQREELLMAVLFALIISPPLVYVSGFAMDWPSAISGVAMDLLVILLLGTSVRDSFKNRHQGGAFVKKNTAVSRIGRSNNLGADCE